MDFRRTRNGISSQQPPTPGPSIESRRGREMDIRARLFLTKNRIKPLVRIRAKHSAPRDDGNEIRLENLRPTNAQKPSSATSGHVDYSPSLPSVFRRQLIHLVTKNRRWKIRLARFPRRKHLRCKTLGHEWGDYRPTFWGGFEVKRTCARCGKIEKKLW